MYAVALKSNMQPYLIETLERIELVHPDGTHGSVGGGRLSRKVPRPSTHASRVDQLIKNPAYLKACCKRTRAWQGGEYPAPTLLKVFFGMSPRGVEITTTTIEVAPESIFPPLHKFPGVSQYWGSEVDKLKIVGPIIERRKPYTSRHYVGVCAESMNTRENLWGYSF
jgi:hypothetical protein